MGKIGEVFADAGLHIDNASFSEYASKLKASEGNISSFAAAHSAALIGTGTALVGVVGGAAAYGATLAAGYEKTQLQMEGLLGSQERAGEMMKWLQDFASTTPFEFPELADASAALIGASLDTKNWMGVIGDWAAGANRSISQVTEGVIDAMGGEWERLKELQIYHVEVMKTNYEQLGLTADQVGQHMLYSYDASGQKIVQVFDKNSKEATEAAIKNLAVEKFEGTMDKVANSLAGKWSTIKDNINNALVDIVGFEVGEEKANGLFLVLQKLADVAITVTGAFSGISEPMQTVILIAGAGAIAAGGLAIGIGLVGTASTLATPGMTALATSINAAIWPATVVVAGIALLAIGLYELEQKTGAVSWAWQLFKDIFTFTVYSIADAAGILRDWIVQKVEEIRQAISDMIPDGWAEKIGGVIDRITGQFGSMGDNIHEKAQKIKGSTDEAGNSVVGMKEKFDSVTPSVNTLTNTMSAGTTTVNQFGYAFKTVASDAGAAATSIEAAASRIGQAITTTADQVGNVSSLAGKWNLRETPGTVKDHGGRGTGEGRVKVVDTHGMYADNKNSKLSKTTVNVGTINNYGESNSQNKKKLKVTSRG